MDQEVIVCAAIVRDKRMLAQQRAEPEDVRGLWELPGGKVELGETEREALQRECVEELDTVVIPGDRVGPDVVLSASKVLRVYAAKLSNVDEEPRAVEHLEVRWLALDELDAMNWLPADRELLPSLKDLLS
jgi:8-oxo-dGTP diphosphatase